jgi:UDPglucose 6-dehydrogenase
MREAPSRVIIPALLSRGASIRAYDPVASEEAARVMRNDDGTPLDRLVFAKSAADALDHADALVIVTEWKEFRTPDFDAMRDALKDRLVFDGRNLYESALIRSFGLEYMAIGRP